MKQQLFSVLFISLMFLGCTKNEKASNNSHGKVNIEPETNIGATGQISIMNNGINYNYTTVRTKDGNVWLQQNLGSSRVAQSVDDTFAFGGFYQWGRWADGHQLLKPEPEVRNPNILFSNNPAGLPLGGINFFIASWWNTGTNNDKWEATSASEVNQFNGCDPCKALGNKWRLPTNDEWNEVLIAENITDASSAFNSNLKIANAGWRSSNSVFLNETIYSSRFWSSTASAANTAFSLLIRSNDVIKNFSDSRSYAMSIRCIQKM